MTNNPANAHLNIQSTKQKRIASRGSRTMTATSETTHQHLTNSWLTLHLHFPLTTRNALATSRRQCPECHTFKLKLLVRRPQDLKLRWGVFVTFRSRSAQRNPAVMAESKGKTPWQLSRDFGNCWRKVETPSSWAGTSLPIHFFYGVLFIIFWVHMNGRISLPAQFPPPPSRRHRGYGFPPFALTVADVPKTT